MKLLNYLQETVPGISHTQQDGPASPGGAQDGKRVEDVIRAAIDFQMTDVVARYSADYDLPIGVAREHEKELKRYLAVAALFPERAYGMMGPVDKMWHVFILDTHKYIQFCDNVAGRYIHHYPERFFGDDLAAANTVSNDTLDWYERFLEDYEACFGEEAPRHIWPRPLDYGEMRMQPICRVCGTDPWKR